MPGGYVSGRKFYSENEYKDAIEDEKLVKKLKNSFDLTNPEEVNELYAALQTGEFSFKTVIGRDFDDEIYELTRKIKRRAETAETKSQAKTKANKKTNLQKKRQTSTGKHTGSESTYADIEAAAQKIIRKQTLQRRIIIALSSAVAVASLGYFIIYSRSAYKTQAAYDELAELKGTTPITDEIEQKPLFTLAENEQPPEILDEYKNIYLKNKSIIGWLTIEDTNIDYPVMQTVNNDYYLTHDFEGKEDRNGALFLDCNCNAAFRSTNLIIYGHHMKSGKMFGNLKKYENEDYAKKHNIILFDTIFEKGKYEVMYVFRDNIRDEEDVSFKYYQFFDAVSENEFYSNLKAMSEMSLFDTGVTAVYGDDLLTLSTCNGSTSTERFVVVAKRIDGHNSSQTYNVEKIEE